MIIDIAVTLQLSDLLLPE